MIKIKRVYEEPSKADGYRILVERLWPRGITKQRAEINSWMKDIAPSTELRKWFGHDPAKWKEFSKRYAVELRQNNDLVKELEKMTKKGVVTFIYAAHDEEHNGALVLKQYLEYEGKENT